MPEFMLNRSAYVNGDEPGVRTPHPFYSLSDFAKGYVEAMFFTNADSGDEKREDHANELGVERLTHKSVAAIKRDCDAFLGYIMPDGCFAQQWINRAVDYDEEQAGRDFWFTRQGHGVGYWDRDALNVDLFEPINPAPGLGGYELRDDEREQGPCRGTIGDGLSEAAKTFGEARTDIYGGWVRHS